MQGQEKLHQQAVGLVDLGTITSHIYKLPKFVLYAAKSWNNSLCDMLRKQLVWKKIDMGTEWKFNLF